MIIKIDLYFYIFLYRIRQLNWVNATHLDCHIDEMNPSVRDLAFTSMLGLYLKI